MFNCRVRVGDSWRHANGVSVIGAGFEQNKLYKGESLAIYFDSVNSWQEFIQRIKRLNGFFAVVIQRENQCYAAVDRVRSIPLFYAVHNNEFFLSDDPYWIQVQIGGQVIDFISILEFLLTGYVTGSHTLDQRIWQFQAGEALVVRPKGTDLLPQTERYYQFLTGKGEVPCLSENELLSKLEEVTLAAIRRLISFADGRPVVIPLSGGLDSRLVAMTLKRLGYKDIIAFSYGVRENWESRISQKVANQLGIPWHFVEYSRALWRQWYWSEECKTYIKYANKLVSLAHLQDWPAVMELVKKGIIPKEAVIVPGHTGDFVTGGHIPAEILNEKGYNIREVIQAIKHHHYVLAPVKIACECANMRLQDGHDALCKRLQSCLKLDNESSLVNHEAIRLYECWEWQERQAKYIVNSVRVYDFFGLEWWLPWWDTEFVSFWEYVPLQLRLHRRLYRHYVRQVEARCGVNIPVSFLQRAKEALKRADKTGLLRRIYGSIRKPVSPASTILAFNGAFELTSGDISILGVAALAQLSLMREQER